MRPQQPTRTILRRWRENGRQWAELECGHTEPNNDLPVAAAIRCTECPPVPAQRTPPPEGVSKP